ncbi:Protein roadkill like protein [Verticillium longisporum]|nr:Protein roadkill like protein [Verticillium longisporum]
MDQTPEQALKEGMKRLRISGDYTDMTIICGDMEYQVHKAIVCPRSKYFDAMFSHGMQSYTLKNSQRLTVLR